MFHILLSYKWKKGIFNMANFVFVGRSNNRYYIETQHSVNTMPLHISICGNGNRTDFLCRYSLIGIGKTFVLRVFTSTKT